MRGTKWTKVRAEETKAKKAKVKPEEVLEPAIKLEVPESDVEPEKSTSKELFEMAERLKILGLDQLAEAKRLMEAGEYSEAKILRDKGCHNLDAYEEAIGKAEALKKAEEEEEAKKKAEALKKAEAKKKAEAEKKAEAVKKEERVMVGSEFLEEPAFVVSGGRFYRKKKDGTLIVVLDVREVERL